MHPRILVVGPGSMGLTHAGLLWRAGLDVTVLDHRPERAQRLNADGYRVSGAAGEFHAAVPVNASAAEVGACGLIIILVKAYSTRDAVAHCADAVSDQSVVLTLQNGLGNLEVLQGAFGPERVLAGTTASGAYRLSDDEVVVAGIGQIALGGEDRRAAERACGLLCAAGLPAQVSDDVQAILWAKAIVNAGINPLGALTRLRNGQLLQAPSVRMLMGRIVREACRVAHAAGVAPGEDLVAMVEEVARKTANNRCSMLQDLTAGRPTEIDYINGYVATLGRELGCSCPVNGAVRDLVAAAHLRRGRCAP
jgi:2-dehydropantoate 2-reductase